MTVTATPESTKFYQKYGFKLSGNLFNRWINGLDSGNHYIKLDDITIGNKPLSENNFSRKLYDA